MSEQEKLFEEFPPVTTQEWMNKIICDLKGADFNKKLVWKTDEGFDLRPFYRQEDTGLLPFASTMPGHFPYMRGTRKNGNRWLIRQNIDVEDYSVANKKALDVLMKGVDSLGLIIKDPETISEKNIEKLLEGIHFESVEINFLSNGRAKEILEYFIKSVHKNASGMSHVRGAIETDPLGRLLMNGSICVPLEAGFDFLASLTDSASSLPHFRTIRVNGSNFTNAGTDIVKELGFTLSMASEYMSQLTGRGISSGLAASKIGFCFGTGSNYFFEIAKIRAARLLWSLIVAAFKPENTDSCAMNIHSITSRWNKNDKDPHINLLRTQTEAMAAVLGGTDSLTVEPFDISFRPPDEFSERIARNQQLILKEEAYFDKVADPAGGSYYIEKLTSLIADNAWRLFLEIEEQGGFIEALNKEFFKKAIGK
jgi:methylmalonyl-CoA mutase